jgi:dTDP-glucose 4,6-dehydratase
LRFIISGAAGFIGSHLCDRLVAEGHHVVAIDNLITGARPNIEHLEGNPSFEFCELDVCQPFGIDGPVDGSPDRQPLRKLLTPTVPPSPARLPAR